jgi:hypothetical protein
MGRPSLRANAEMRRLIDALGSPSLPPLSGSILRGLDDGVVEVEGCVLLRAMRPAAGRSDAPPHRDHTHRECSINRHRFDALHGADRALATALTYAGQLVEMLERSGCAGPFRVILSRDPADRSCNVRFHRLRQDESWLADDLESYGEEAVLVLDCAE